MNSDKNTPRLLGAAFLIVVFASLTSGLLLSSAVGSGGISDMLLNISNKVTLLRTSILFEMLNSSAIVVLAVLLYTVLSKQNKILALVALGWWLGEALILGLTNTGISALIPLSLDFVKAGAPQHSFYQTLGEFLYYGVYQHGYSGIHMWFYSIGGILWYYLFYRSKYIPRVISLWGLIAACLSIVGVVFIFYGYDVPIFVFLPLLPFELTIGTWLMLKGIKDVQ
jgi:hypothetical protein